MFRRIKIWQFILAITIILSVARFCLLADTFLLMFYYAGLFIKSASLAFAQIDFPLIDSFISALLLLIIIIYLSLRGRKRRLFQNKINFTSAAIILLVYIFIFAPVITDNNPNFQKELSVTKLLPPLSKIKVLHLKAVKEENASVQNRFFVLRSSVVKAPFDENIIFADSVSTGDTIKYYQGGSEYAIGKDKIKTETGIPIITERIFILGTDELGRDIFTRLIYGARISLFIGFGAVAISLILGLCLGFFAGFSGGIFDSALNRVTDMFLAFPVIFFIILIIALFGNSISSVIIVLGFSGWMSLFKIVRGEVISLKKKDFFISAQNIGLSNLKLLLNEALPYMLIPVVVNLVFQYGNVILAEAALSYLGLGTGSNYPSWGSMIEAGQNYLSRAWWMILFPGIALFFTLFAANSLGRKINSSINPRIYS